MSPVPPASPWEVVTEQDREVLERLAVPGGWLYRTVSFDQAGRTVATALVFVPDLTE